MGCVVDAENKLPQRIVRHAELDLLVFECHWRKVRLLAGAIVAPGVRQLSAFAATPPSHGFRGPQQTELERAPIKVDHIRKRRSSLHIRRA